MTKKETSKPLVDQLTYPENDALAKIKLGNCKENVVLEFKDLALNTRFNKSPTSVGNYVNATENRIFELLNEAEGRGEFDEEKGEKLCTEVSALLFKIKDRLLKALAEERKTEGLTVDDQVSLNKLDLEEIKTLNDLGVEGVRGVVKKHIAQFLRIMSWNRDPFSIGQYAKQHRDFIKYSYEEAEGKEGGGNLDEEKQTVYRLLHTVKERYLKVLRKEREDQGIRLRGGCSSYGYDSTLE